MTQILPASLVDVVSRVKRCDPRYSVDARRRLDNLTKPIGSLGRLEALAAQMFSIFLFFREISRCPCGEALMCLPPITAYLRKE
jgi:hypothetical protein